MENLHLEYLCELIGTEMVVRMIPITAQKMQTVTRLMQIMTVLVSFSDIFVVILMKVFEVIWFY